MITKTSAQAQNEFGQLLDLAQREPVAITRHGRPAAFIIAGREMEGFEEYWKSRGRRAVAAFDHWAEKYANEVSPEAQRLTDEDIVRMVHEAHDEEPHSH